MDQEAIKFSPQIRQFEHLCEMKLKHFCFFEANQTDDGWPGLKQIVFFFFKPMFWTRLQDASDVAGWGHQA